MTSTPPLPKLHPSGAVFATKQQVKWWPSPEYNREQLQKVEDGSTNKPIDHETAVKMNAGDMNDAWVARAKEHLVNYVVPTDTSGSYSQIARDVHGLVSEAANRMRDSNVVYDSLPNLDAGTREGIEIQHRDILAAIALLTRLDGNVKGNWFREEGFKAAPDKKS